jgi:hypothetical protein
VGTYFLQRGVRAEPACLERSIPQGHGALRTLSGICDEAPVQGSSSLVDT